MTYCSKPFHLHRNYARMLTSHSLKGVVHELLEPVVAYVLSGGDVVVVVVEVHEAVEWQMMDVKFQPFRAS